MVLSLPLQIGFSSRAKLFTIPAHTLATLSHIDPVCGGGGGALYKARKPLVFGIPYIEER